MKILRIAIPVLAILVTCACDKLDYGRVDMNYFYGYWQEYYGPDYQVEGSRTWHIVEGTISINTYDWYSDTQWEVSLNYTLEQNKGKNIVTLHYQEDSETNDQSYYITKLTDEEMVWQNVTLEGDKQHFVNSKYWANHTE